jgi:small-conductance mechanosensitive channel
MDSWKFLLEASVWKNLGISALILLAALACGFVLHRILFGVLGRILRRTPWGEKTLSYTRKPSSILFPLLIINLVAPFLDLPGRPLSFLNHVTAILFIGSFSYLFVSLIRLLRDFLLSRHDIQAADNLRARKIYTQVHVLEKVLLSIVAVVSISFILMTFDSIRQIGVSLLASAGIAGIIIGIAAQKSIGTLLAGIQVALTQPIRVDDVVIVEGEWGRIEEITLTYVVVRIWDLRRLVLPITYFIEKPFQNWTRSSSDLLGSVFIHTDYTVPVDAIRRELERIVKPHPLWDGKVCVVHVTDCKPWTLETRLLVSTRSSGDGWELRCHIREKMVEFLQKNYPESLPRMRAEMNGPTPPEQKKESALDTGQLPFKQASR